MFLCVKLQILLAQFFLQFMGKLILVRHGESVGNRDRMFAVNPQALALTELGYRQAEQAGQRIVQLYQAELVVSSPYVRARETARVIAEALDVPLAIEDSLHERLVGVHQGQSYDSIFTAPGYDAKRPWTWQPQGGESFEEVKARVGAALDQLARLHPARDVVVVSHGGVMSALWAHVTGDWESVHMAPNCGFVLIEHGAHGYSMPQVIGDAGCEQHTGG